MNSSIVGEKGVEVVSINLVCVVVISALTFDFHPAFNLLC